METEREILVRLDGGGEAFEATDAEYRSSPGLSQSALKCFLADPQLYREIQTGARQPSPPTESMIFGSRVDDFILRELSPAAVIIPDGVLNKDGHRKGKAWTDFAASNPGKELLKPDEYRLLFEPLQAIERNILLHEKANRLIYEFAGKNHVCIRWVDGETGLLLKAQMDRVLDRGCVVDLKTAADNSPSGFAKAAANFGYHVQQAHYLAGCRAVFPRAEKFPLVQHFAFVVAKNKPSYSVEAYQLDERFAELGERTWRAGINRYLAALENQDWSTPTHGEVVQVAPPRWLEYAGQYELETVE